MLYTNETALVYKYSSRNVGFNSAMVADLITKGYLKDLNPRAANYDTDNLEVTPKFIKYVDSRGSLDRAKEFWNLYPSFIYINGEAVPARNVDYDKFSRDYENAIGKNPELHTAVVEGLKQAIKKNVVKMGIVKWLSSRQWEAITYTPSNATSDDLPGFNEF